MKKIIISLLFCLLLVSVSSAQLIEDARNQQSTPGNLFGAQPTMSPSALLDLSKIRFSHSYSVSFFSGGGYSGSTGLMNSSMFWDLSPKLSLGLNLGILHNPGSLLSSNVNTDATILPGFSLDYRPSEHFQLNISVQRSSGMLSPYYNGTNSRFYRSGLYR